MKILKTSYGRYAIKQGVHYKTIKINKYFCSYNIKQEIKITTSPKHLGEVFYIFYVSKNISED